MVYLMRNNFAGGPSGTTLTTGNTGQQGDNAFAAIFKTGANTVNAFDLAPDRPTAEFVMNASTGAAAGKSAVAWSPVNVAQLYTRMYLYYSVLPNNFISPTFFYTEDLVGQMMIAAVNSSGASQIILADSNSANAVTTVGGITAAQWFRIEIRAQFSATTGNAELRWYDDPDSDTPTEILTTSSQNFRSSNCSSAYYGYINTDSNLEALRISGIELNDTGWPGPAPFRPGKGVPGIQPNPVAIHTDIW